MRWGICRLSSVVRLPHLRAALEVWRYCRASAAYLFGDRLGDPTADDILSALRRVWPDSLTRSEISRELFGRNKQASEIQRALSLLEEHHLARHDQDRTGDGRPTERWFALSESYDINEFDDITPDPEEECEVQPARHDDISPRPEPDPPPAGGYVVTSSPSDHAKTPTKDPYVVNVGYVVAPDDARPDDDDQAEPDEELLC
jgi:hypothetical protein